MIRNGLRRRSIVPDAPVPDELGRGDEAHSTVDIISTRQVAELLAVSEATVKRWSDAGSLRCFKTPGGHRKFRMEDVADFLRSYQYDSAGPAAAMVRANETTPAPTAGSGGPAINAPGPVDPETVVQFRNAALSADVDALVSQIAQGRLRGLTLVSIFDDVVTPALFDIGERWSRGVLTVSQEHMASAAVIEALARTRPLIERTAHGRGKILLACPGDEQHDIAVRMASLLAHGLGFRAMLVGARVPVADLALLIAGERPRFVVVSASIVVDPTHAAQDLASLAEAARAVSAVIVAGGSGYVTLANPPANVRFARSMTELLAAFQAG
ncbi:MAG: helix-turn-helix domain-containing protein [Deltaproteobacteria bacterium]